MKENSIFSKKEDLINAALNEFAENVYENASLNVIIKNAGISKGTFYYHFKNKEDLYFFIMDKVVKEKLEYISGNSNNKNFDFNDIFEVLKQQAKLGIEFASKFPIYSRIGQNFLKNKENEIYLKVKKRFSKESDNFFEMLIKSNIENGNLRKDLPTDFIIKIISFIFINSDQIMEELLDFNNLEKSLNYVEHLIETLKNGLSDKK